MWGLVVYFYIAHNTWGHVSIPRAFHSRQECAAYGREWMREIKEAVRFTCYESK